MTIRSKKRKAAKAKMQQPAGLENLQAPFSRGDLALIRQAINQRWPTDEKTRQLIVEGVLSTRDQDCTTDRNRKSGTRTLILINQIGWIR